MRPQWMGSGGKEPASWGSTSCVVGRVLVDFVVRYVIIEPELVEMGSTAFLHFLKLIGDVVVVLDSSDRGVYPVCDDIDPETTVELPSDRTSSHLVGAP